AAEVRATIPSLASFTDEAFLGRALSMRNQLASFAAICALLAAGCTPEPEAPESAAAPPPPAAPAGEVITAARGGFIPEGIEYDRANGRFLTGSIAEGSIFVIGRDGSVTPLISDP